MSILNLDFSTERSHPLVSFGFSSSFARTDSSPLKFLIPFLEKTIIPAITLRGYSFSSLETQRLKETLSKNSNLKKLEF